MDGCRQTHPHGETMSNQTIRAAAVQIRSRYAASQIRLCEQELAAFRDALYLWQKDRKRYIARIEYGYAGRVHAFTSALNDVRCGYPRPANDSKEDRVIYYLDEVVPTLHEVRELELAFQDPDPN